jgi:UDP-N-acetylglucosamine 2-epimerase (non-hydrolysing)
LKPVAHALVALGITPTLVLTGQHALLEPNHFGLGGFPAFHLGCAGQEDPHEHVRAVTSTLLPLLLRHGPDLLVVQGDTSSALGGALAGFTSGVPVAHVEAGLRTHDPLLPWPEEEYRTAIDADADLLFAPTGLAAANLRAEGVPGDIHVTGNTGVDAALEAISRLPPRAAREGAPPRILVTCHRRESWELGLKSIAAAATELAADGAEVELVLHPNAFVVNAMRRSLGSASGVRLLDACGHDELLRRMRDADLVLSDSGGIQEEAPTLGVPLLVLREKTERPEGIADGTAVLVGTDTARIVGEARRLLGDPAAREAMSRRVFPFGDGRAAQRIARIIEGWLEVRRSERRLA